MSIDAVEDAMSGRHLRAQRQLAGFSIRALAQAANLSPTRIRQVEDAEQVTSRATARYLKGIGQAWKRRAEESTREAAS